MSVTVIGEAYVDLIAPVDNINPGETHHREIKMFAGGLANVAIQVSKLGEKAKFIGKVGSDPFGNYLRQKLKENGVRDLTIVDPEAPTGLCVSLAYESGERTMIANRGANDNLTNQDVESHLDEIKESKIIYFSGYSILKERTKAIILKCIEKCRKDSEIYFNTGASNSIRENFKDVIKDLVDVLILNQDEARILTRRFESLNDLVSLAVVTQSSEGCSIIKNKKIITVKTKKINAKDTTGAGDVFAAGFIAGKLKGLNEEERAKLGNEAALKFIKEKMEALV